MGYVMSPSQVKLKFTRLLRVAYILLLIGYSVSLVPSLALTFMIGGMYSGSYMFYYLFYFLGFFGGTILSGLGSLLNLAGYIVLIIALVKLASVSTNPEFKRKSKITMVLFIVTLSINLLLNSLTLLSGGIYSFLYSFIYSFYGYGMSGIFGYIALIVTGLFIATFIMLSLTMKELRIESQTGDHGLVSAFIYPIVIIPQILHLTDFLDFIDSSLIIIVIFLLSELIEFIVLLILSIEGLTASSKILRSLTPQSMPIQIRSEPTFNPQISYSNVKTTPRFCMQCGARLVENAKFCGNCGQIVK